MHHYEREEKMSEAEILKHLSDEDLCKSAILAVKFEELMKTLNRIADALENLDRKGITIYPVE